MDEFCTVMFGKRVVEAFISVASVEGKEAVKGGWLDENRELLWSLVCMPGSSVIPNRCPKLSLVSVSPSWVAL